MIRPLLGCLALALLVAGGAASAPRTKCPAGTSFAELALLDGGKLLVLDMPGCNGRVLVARGARPPVRWSADGLYLSFGGGVVHRDGGHVARGLRGTWSPVGHRLAAVTPRGGVLLGGPGVTPRRLVPDGFGAQSLAFDPAGKRVAVGRTRPGGTAPPRNREVWIVDLATGTRQLVYRQRAGDSRAPVVWRWPSGGFVLVRLARWPAASANVDGLPLRAVPVRGGPPRAVVGSILSYDEFVADCRGELLLSAGFDRMATHAKRLVTARPPRWRPRDLSRDRSRSWIAPACSRGGRWIAVSAGRDRVQARFGLERRSIWLVDLDGRGRRRVTAPPRGSSDELPRWSADGRGLFFVRTGPTRGDATAPGRLFVLRLGASRPEVVADLGTTGNYYGRYGWAEQTDLFLPRVR